MVQCNRCNLQYIGETKQRLNPGGGGTPANFR